MRPAPFSRPGFQFCRPGKVSRAANPISSADPSRDMLSAMPLAVTPTSRTRVAKVACSYLLVNVVTGVLISRREMRDRDLV